jgi:hypothetical protein
MLLVVGFNLLQDSQTAGMHSQQTTLLTGLYVCVPWDVVLCSGTQQDRSASAPSPAATTAAHTASL